MPKSLNSQLISMMFATKRAFLSSLPKDLSPMNFIQAEVMSFILNNKKTLSKDLAEHLNITPPSATSLVDKLSKLGYIKRVPSKSDRRKVFLHVTPKGIVFIKEIYKISQKSAEKMFDLLNEEDKKNLLKIYKKILNNFS